MRPNAAIIIVPLVLGACAGDRDPAWAFDPIWLEPSAGGVHGFQTWNLYSRAWKRKHDERRFLCAAVVELYGTPTTCAACTEAWDLEAELIEHDCDAGWVGQPLYTSLVRVGVGGVVSAEAPHPGRTSEGLADYGTGWETHGHAYAAALDVGGEGPDTWDGEAAFQLWPTAAFPL